MNKIDTVQLPNAVSIVIRCKNEVASIEQTLSMIKQQDYCGSVELIVFDSGSTDGSLDIIKRECPDKIHCLLPQEYIPGKVINEAMKRSTNDWVIFLNADATPASKQWLCNLLAGALQSKNFGAAFCRQIPRENCRTVFARDYEKCFGINRQSKKWSHFFSMVGSLIYKPVWKQHQLREDLQYAEDDEWTRRLARNGFDIVYAEDSAVIHSHNYTIKESYTRSLGDSKASTIAGTITPDSINLLNNVLLSCLWLCLKDIPYHIKYGKVFELPYTCAVRFAQKYGQWKGNHVE